MGKIIIGIHGLGNKPQNKKLTKWWKASIHEGLKRIGCNRLFLRFEMVYWADIIYESPLDSMEKDKENEFYLDEPYVPSLKYLVKKPSELRKKILDYIEKQLDKIFLNDDMSLNYSFVTDMIIQHFFKDLDIYYTKQKPGSSSRSVKEATKKRIVDILRKHKDSDILLLSHSMGTIIAYDVLTHDARNIPIDTFVTMGSPLGLPAVMNKIAVEQQDDPEMAHELRTPENVVRSWYNFSDLEDKIAFNYNLGDDYQENSHHIKAHDVVVYNDYINNEEKNPHKSYGYLRTPELAEVINAFLDHGRNKRLIHITKWINKLVSWK